MRRRTKILAAVAASSILAFVYFRTKKRKQAAVEDDTQTLSIESTTAAPLVRIPNPTKISQDSLYQSDSDTENNPFLPGVVIKFEYNERKQNIGESFFELPFTPTTADKEKSKIDFKKNPWDILSKVNNLKGERLSNMISPTELLQIINKCGLQQTKNISIVSSHNKKNKFIVGYSDSINITTGNKKTTPAHNILWAISFGVPYDKRPHTAEALASLEDDTFEDVALRTLLAETGGSLSLGAETQFISDNQKAAILACLITRKNRKKERGRAVEPVTFKTVIKSKDLKPTRAQNPLDLSNDTTAKWAVDIAFHCLYSGRPNHKCVTTFKDALKLDELPVPEKAEKKFKQFFERTFWQMPNFIENGPGHLFHYRHNLPLPPWLSSTSSYVKDEDAYFHHRHPIRIGNGIFVDRSQEYT